MNREKLVKMAEMITGTLTEEELKVLIERLEEVRNGKTEQKEKSNKAAERRGKKGKRK